MKYLPTTSALLHSRFLFSVFLLPVYVFALSQAQFVNKVEAVLTFVVWHLCIYPASNGYNSYFDKDETSIALLEKPPAVDKSLYYFSIFLDLVGFLLAALVSIEFAGATVIYSFLSKLYSHPAVRLKKLPIISFLVVFVFQGAFVYWATYSAVSGTSIVELWSREFLTAGLICSFLVGASYPLTQIYQHEEDRKRGDNTLSITLGIKGTFVFTAILFLIAIALMFAYWRAMHELENFWAFLIFMIPVIAVFVAWIIKVKRDPAEVNFRNANNMCLVSGSAMLAYFLLLLVIKNL